MKFKSLFGIGLLAALAVSCALNEPSVPIQEEQTFPVLEATFEVSAPATKAHSEGTSVVWDAKDKLSVFYRSTAPLCFALTGEAGGTTAEFEYLNGTPTGNKFSYILAFYPYSDAVTLATDGTVSFEWPGEQVYAEDGFSAGSNPMIASSEEVQLAFKNLGGYLVIPMWGEDATVKSVTLRGNDGELIAGPAIASYGLNSSEPWVEMTEEATDEIVLTCTEPVTVGASEDEATPFWFVLPADTYFEAGFTIVVEFEDGTTAEFSADGADEDYYIERNEMFTMLPLCIKNPPVPVEELVFDNPDILAQGVTLYVGDTFPLDVTVSPEDATDQTLTFTSDDEDKVTVDEEGVITAVAPTDEDTPVIVKIETSNPEVFAEVPVTVLPIPVDEIIFDFDLTTDDGIELTVGETFEITVSVNPPEADPSVTFESADTDYVTVDENGVITAVQVTEEPVAITVTSVVTPETTATLMVTVLPIQVEELQFTDESILSDGIQLQVGDSQQIEFSVVPENATFPEVTFESANPDFVTVDETGLVTAVALPDEDEPIIVTISTSNPEVYYEVPVTVLPVLVEEVIVEPAELDIFIGDDATLTLTVLPENASYQDVQWVVDTDEETVPVQFDEDTYTVHGISAGTATITAMSKDGSDVSGICVVTVSPVLVSSIRLDSDVLETDYDPTADPYPLGCTIEPENATDPSVTWESSDENVVTVDQEGNISIVGVGEADITVTANDGGGATATCHVIINPILVTDIELSDYEVELFLGEDDTYILEYTVCPEEPVAATNPELTWSSSDEGVVTVEDGVITVVGPGEATVTAAATDGSGVTAECAVTVIKNIIESIEGLEDLELWLGEDEEAEFTYELLALNPDHDIYDATLTWESSDEDVVTVADGVVTVVGPGEATITVSGEDAEASATVTVNKNVISAIVGLESLELWLGEDEEVTLQYELIPTYEGHAIYDETLTWESSDETVATVEDGVLTVVGPGEATITVSGEEAEASFAVTVIKNYIESIELDEELTYYVDEVEADIEMNYEVFPVDSEHPIYDDTLIWESSNEAVVTVVDGVLSFSGLAGDADITVTADDGGATATCHVTVIIREVEGITVDPSSVEGMRISESVTVTAEVSPENATYPDLEVSVEPEGIVSVEVTDDGAYEVTALAEGTATITFAATDGSGVTGTCTVEVIYKAVESIELDKTTATIMAGEAFALTATVTPGDADDPSVTWTSSDETVATVDENGNVTTDADTVTVKHVVTITATSVDNPDVSATCTLTVKPFIDYANMMTTSPDVDMESFEGSTPHTVHSEVALAGYDQAFESIKDGTGNGSSTLVIPVAVGDVTRYHFHAMCNTSGSTVTVSAKDADGNAVTVTPASFDILYEESGFPTNDKNFSCSNPDQAYVCLEFATPLPAGSTITLSCSGHRMLLWGINPEYAD